MAASDYTFGCPVAPLILDGAGSVMEIEQICRQAFAEWTGVIRDALITAEIPPSRADTLAIMVEATHEGLFLISHAYRDTAPLMDVAAELETLLLAALTEAGSHQVCASSSS